jgi:cobalt/nickel transport system permease protein
MAGNLFVRSIERSDRIYHAMLARGYDGEVRTTHLPGLRQADWLILASGLGILLLMLLLSLMLAS